MTFVWPETLATILPFAVAAITTALGLCALFTPRLALRLFALGPTAKRPGDLSGARDSLAGFWIGVGIVALLFFDQPFVQMALGAGWLFSAFGRLVSLLSDQSSATGWVVLLLELLLAAAALGPPFGFIM